MRGENSLEKRLSERPPVVIGERTHIPERTHGWPTELHHSLPMETDFQPSNGSSYVQRMHDHQQLPSTFPNWFEALKAAILNHCFGADFSHTSRIMEVSEQEIASFVSELNPPPYLTTQQKLLLNELLQNMEAWWSSSFAAMQSIHEESAQIMGFNALSMPPSPLPLYIQHRLKTIVRSVMQLLKSPTAAGSSMTPKLESASVLDLHYWTMLAQEHRTNPKMVLREWMFQHFDKPYPTDQDKQMLSDVTGMSRSQVSNWFINARVRIWQPMVLELGKELEEEVESGEEISSTLKTENAECQDSNRMEGSMPMDPLGSYPEPAGEMLLHGHQIFDSMTGLDELDGKSSLQDLTKLEKRRDKF